MRVIAKLDMCEIETFIKGKENRKWVTVGNYHVYLRKAHHHIAGKIVKTLDLANITTIDDLPYGGFWELYAALLKFAKADGASALFLENTYNKGLYEAYKQRGCVPTEDGMHCLYKFV